MDAIDIAIIAYLDYIEALETCTEEEHTTVLELVELIKNGRGIDPYAERPSLEGLLEKIRDSWTMDD